MTVVGKFKVRSGFNLGKRGLVVIGDILEGKVKVGSFTKIDFGYEQLVLKIGSVEMGDDRSTGDYYVGLTFVYDSEEQKNELLSQKPEVQIIEIWE